MVSDDAARAVSAGSALACRRSQAGRATRATRASATWLPGAKTANLLGMRLDKWRWAARFFKTRSLASSEVDGGHVELNGERARPAKQIRVGDELRIRMHQNSYVVHVRGLSERR